jgi:hypothetical protein
MHQREVPIIQSILIEIMRARSGSKRRLPEMGAKFQYSSAACMMVLVVAVAIISTLLFPSAAGDCQLLLFIQFS